MFQDPWLVPDEPHTRCHTRKDRHRSRQTGHFRIALWKQKVPLLPVFPAFHHKPHPRSYQQFHLPDGPSVPAPVLLFSHFFPKFAARVPPPALPHFLLPLLPTAISTGHKLLPPGSPAACDVLPLAQLLSLRSAPALLPLSWLPMALRKPLFLSVPDNAHIQKDNKKQRYFQKWARTLPPDG